MFDQQKDKDILLEEIGEAPAHGPSQNSSAQSLAQNAPSSYGSASPAQNRPPAQNQGQAPLQSPPHQNPNPGQAPMQNRPPAQNLGQNSFRNAPSQNPNPGQAPMRESVPRQNPAYNPQPMQNQAQAQIYKMPQGSAQRPIRPPAQMQGGARGGSRDYDVRMKKNPASIVFLVLFALLVSGGLYYYFNYYQKEDGAFADLDPIGDNDGTEIFDEEVDMDWQEDEFVEEQFLFEGNLALDHYMDRAVVQSRDASRKADAEQIGMEIDRYLQENGRLPKTMNELYAASAAIRPSDPKPNTACGDTFDYRFNIFEDAGNYEVIYCQEQGSGVDEIGENSFYSNREIEVIKRAVDTDGDGLNDYIEEYIFGTDKTKTDTDGDGYDDFTEVTSGYDPLGPGKLDLRDSPDKFLFGLIFTDMDYQDAVYLDKGLLAEIVYELETSETAFFDLLKKEIDFDWIADLKEIKFQNYLDENNVYIGANVMYQNGTSGAMSAYFIRIDNKWYINIEPELILMRSDQESWQELKNAF